MNHRRKISLPYILPDINDVIRRLNYNPKKTSLDERTILLIKDAIEKSKKYIHPVSILMDIQIKKIHNGNITFENNLTIHSFKLSNVLKNSTKSTFMALTIGNEINLKIQKLTEEENFTEAVIFDAIGSEAVESFANQIQGLLEREKKLQGLIPVMRYSPGYGDLSLKYQSDIIKLLNAEEIGITMNPQTLILSPEKSITAILGWTNQNKDNQQEDNL